MDIKALQAFVHLASTLHFGRTAEAMYVSTSTLSRQIQRLEEMVGAPLLLRDSRRVSLTSEGQKFLRYAEQSLLAWKQLQHELHFDGEQLSGRLRLFCSVTAAYSHLPPIMDRFRAQQPQVEITLTTGDAAMGIEQIETGQADLAIVARPEQLPGRLHFRYIDDVAMNLIAPTIPCQVSEQLAHSKIEWDQVPFILPLHGPMRRRIDRWFKQMKIRPLISAQVAGHEALVSMVALGCGVGIAPQVVVSNCPVQDRIRQLHEGETIEPFELGVICLQSQSVEPITAAFLQTVDAG